MPRIMDAFLFYNEIDLLRVRLDYLRPVVDEFVLVECDRDHSNRPIEPVFEQHKAEFADYPIRHVIVRDLPDGTNNWPRVWWHRNAMLRGVEDAADDDIVLTSDLDEIPAQAYVALAKLLGLSAPVDVCEMDMFYYEPTLRSVDQWTGTRACTAKTLREVSPEGVRHRSDEVFPRTGWHFSYFGGAERIKQKIESIAESAFLAHRQFTDLDAIRARVRAGADLYDRADQKWERVPLDPNFPPGIEQFCWPEGGDDK